MLGLDWKIGLELLKVLLSWPPVAAAITVFLVLTFREPLKKLIGRIRSFDWATKKIELDQGQSNVALNAVRSTEVSPQQEAPTSQTGGEEIARLQAREASERSAAHIWEYRFLNLFFVPRTQAVINWLVEIGGITTVHAFAAHWHGIPPSEPAAILDALRAHHLIEVDGQGLSLTAKGREYAAWDERVRFLELRNAQESGSI